MTISDLKLEQLALGELSVQDEAAIRALLESDEEASTRLAEIESTTPQLLEAFPPLRVRQEVERRVHIAEAREKMRSEPTLIERVTMGFRLVAMAACVVVAMTFLLPEGDEQPDFRLKGGIELVVHRVMGEAAERLDQDTSVRAGDRLQVSLLGAVGHHVVVVSVDGRGEVTLHYPRHGASLEITEQAFSLPTSYQLDDAPSFERFFVVSADTQIDPSRVVEAVEGLAASGGADAGHLDGLPREWATSSLRLVKGIQ